MNEIEAGEMLKELSERHSVPLIASIFHLKPIVMKKELVMKMGGSITQRTITKGAFSVNQMTGERWIDFYGRPSSSDVRSVFQDYLLHLGVDYVRKSPTSTKEEG